MHTGQMFDLKHLFFRQIVLSYCAVVWAQSQTSSTACHRYSGAGHSVPACSLEMKNSSHFPFVDAM